MAEGFAGFEQETERMFESQGEKSGTCAVCVVLTDTDGLYRLSVANLGDCRAVIARKDGQKFVCVSLTKDHRAESTGVPIARFRADRVIHATGR